MANEISGEANQVYANGPTGSPWDPPKAAIRHLFGTVDRAVTGAADGLVQKSTWAQLVAITGTRDGQPGRVMGVDAGTHTDPVVGGTVVNVGEYAWYASPAGWKWLSVLHVGVDGEDGAPGAPGTNGTNGTNGRDGVDNLSQRYRPGDAPILHSHLLTGGDPALLAALTSADTLTDSDGAVVRIAGTGIVSARTLFALEPARLWRLRYVVRRRTNSADPSNDTVRLAVEWYDQNKIVLAGGAASTVIRDITDLTTGSGRAQVIETVSRSAGLGDNDAPANARYGRMYVQTLGSADPRTDVEILDAADVTDLSLWSPDVASLDGRIAAQEGLLAGERLDDLESEVGTPSIRRYTFLASAIAATIGADPDELETVAYATTGDKGGARYRRAGSEPAHLGKFQSADGAWWEMNEPNPREVQFGAFTATADSMAALRKAASYCNAKGITRLIVDEDLVCTTYSDPADMLLLADITPVGSGSLTGVYRKRVIPLNAPSPELFGAEVIAERDLVRLNLPAKPIIIPAGNSWGTGFANSLGHTELWAENLRNSIEKDLGGPVGYFNRSIGGTTPLGLSVALPQNFVPWAIEVDKIWDSYIQDLLPDLIAINAGENPYYDPNVLVNQQARFDGWSRKVDVLWISDPCPSMNSPDPTFQEGKAGQENRDKAAGMLRTWCQYYGRAFVDAHRRACMVRDGFDPCSSALRKGDTIAANVGGTSIRSTTECYDYKAIINLKYTLWDDATPDNMTVKTGSGENDYIQVIRVDSTHYRFIGVCGGGVTSYVYFDTTVVASTFNTDGPGFTFEKQGNMARFYNDLVGLGGYSEPIFATRIIALGGLYLPTINAGGTATLVSAAFSYGEPRLFMPSATNTELYGRGIAGVDPDYGGSGWNHPGGRMMTLVHRPLFDAIEWSCSPEINMRAKASVTQTIAGAAVTVVNLATEQRDNGDYFDPTTGRWTPPRGVYHVILSLNISAGLIAGELVQPMLYKSGTVVALEQFAAQASPAPQSFVCAASFEATGTDYYDFRVQCSNSANKTIEVFTHMHAFGHRRRLA